MTHLAKSRASLSGFGAALLIGLATFGSARTASASSNFPAKLKEALEQHFPGQTFCVPLCTACHNTTKGGPGDPNVFGKNMELHGFLTPGSVFADKLPDEIKNYFAATPGPGDPQVNGKWDSDLDGFSDEQELMELSSPSIAGPRGVGAFCTDLAYGCGARIAPAPPPVDRVGLFSAGLVVLGLAAWRRRRRVPITK
jgi:hypothetical protein